jgi:plasmid stabilization system protein ParE
MNYLLSIRDKAINEIEESYKYYEEQQVGLGENFVSEVFNEISYIQEHPLHFRKVIKNYRQLKVNRFPFLIVYELIESENEVVVVSVFHTSRNPKEKNKK